MAGLVIRKVDGETVVEGFLVRLVILACVLTFVALISGLAFNKLFFPFIELDLMRDFILCCRRDAALSFMELTFSLRCCLVLWYTGFLLTFIEVL